MWKGCRTRHTDVSIRSIEGSEYVVPRCGEYEVGVRSRDGVKVGGSDGSGGEWDADQGFVPVDDADVGFVEGMGWEGEEEDQQLDEGGPHRGRRRRRSRLSLTNVDTTIYNTLVHTILLGHDRVWCSIQVYVLPQGPAELTVTMISMLRCQTQVPHNIINIIPTWCTDLCLCSFANPRSKPLLLL